MLILASDLARVLRDATFVLDRLVDDASIDPVLRALAAEVPATIPAEEDSVPLSSASPTPFPFDVFVGMTKIGALRAGVRAPSQNILDDHPHIVGAICLLADVTNGPRRNALFDVFTMLWSAYSKQDGPPRIQSVVDVARTRYACDAMTGRAHIARARAALHRANADGRLAEHVQRQCWDLITLAALARSGDLLDAIRNATHEDSAFEACIRVIAEEVERRYP